MTKLAKNHPFIIEALALEDLESRQGLSEEIIDRRMKLASQYSGYYKEYIKAKEIKQEQRIYHEKIEKIKEIKNRGCEAISYYKNKIEQIKKVIVRMDKFLILNYGKN